MYLPIKGCTWNNKNALTKIVNANNRIGVFERVVGLFIISAIVEVCRWEWRASNARARKSRSQIPQNPTVFRLFGSCGYTTAMNQPTPESITPEEALELARKVLEVDRFPYLATMDDDQPRLRPVSPVRTDGFTVYVANLRPYGKTKEIEANPKVELCYLDEGHNQVRITGLAVVVDDRSVLQSIWDENPLLRKYLGSIDNPELIVYRIDPNRVRYMREWALNYHEVDFRSA